MGKLYALIFILVFSFSNHVIAQSTDAKSNEININSKVEMTAKVDVFEKTTNEALKLSTTKSSLDQFMLNDEDLEYWVDQFEFTEEVLRQMSKEEFYNKLESWAIDARTNLLFAIKDVDNIKLGTPDINFSKESNMRVNKSANVDLQLIKDGAVINVIRLTFIELKGRLKLIKAQ